MEQETINRRQRLRCILCLSEEEVDAVLRGGINSVSAKDIENRTKLQSSKIRQIIDSEQVFDSYFINPNQVSQAQLHLIPGLESSRIRKVFEGRPFFSLSELQMASGLSQNYLKQIFALPALELIDPLGQRTQRFEAVVNRYMLYPRSEFESSDVIRDCGFFELGGAKQSRFRIVESGDFEITSSPHDLKAAFGGQVFPVLRDNEGFSRLFAPGSVDVWFKTSVSNERALQILGEHKLRITQSFSPHGHYIAELIDLPDDFHITAATLQTIDSLNRNPEVYFAEPNQIAEESFDPSIEVLPPDFEEAAAGRRFWNLDLIDLSDAHRITKGSSTVTMLIVDSGLHTEHPDLQDALRPGWSDLDLNFEASAPRAKKSPTGDAVSHGTQVAGVAGGRGSALDVGIRGVAPGCWILPFKITGSEIGESYAFRAEAILAAIESVSPGHRAVLNISWKTNGEVLSVREALIRASEQDIAIVTSAGNYSESAMQVANKKHYPSSYAWSSFDNDVAQSRRDKIRNLISVAAVNSDLRKASYSYFGENSVTVSAPGGERGTSGRGIYLATAGTKDYVYGAGTSFAAPHVSGILALIFSLDSTLTARAAIEILCKTVKNLDANNPTYKGMLGVGLVNAHAALNQVRTIMSASADSSSHCTKMSSKSKRRININEVGVEELTCLPTIGSWSASKIVSYRELHGPFATIWELESTGAIDGWALRKISHRLVVIDEPDSTPIVDDPSRDNFFNESEERLNVNTASVDLLETLPLIGSWSASRIVEFRDQNGPYVSIWSLTDSGAVDRMTIRNLETLVSVN